MLSTEFFSANSWFLVRTVNKHQSSLSKTETLAEASTGWMRFFLTGSALILAGCASQPTMPAVSSTYPMNQVRTIVSRTAIPIPVDVKVKATAERESGDGESIEYSPGRINLGTETSKEVVGDDALATVWILPEGRRQANEKFLLDKIAEVGQSTCNGRYKISESRYFYGTEATLEFLDLSGPALRVTYRCTARRLPSDDTDLSIVLDAATRFEDHEFFDASTFDLECGTTAVTRALELYLVDQAAEVAPVRKAEGAYIVSAEYLRRTLAYKAPEQLIALVRGVGQRTKLSLALLRYRKAEHKRGVSGAGTAQPGFEWGTMPVARNAAFIGSQKLAAQLATSACE